jgi:Protein kinase domain
MRHKGQLLFGRYVILGSFERRVGGQGCVQFVQDTLRPTVTRAVKFFLNEDAFARERALYEDARLRAMMVATHEIGTGAEGRQKAPDGEGFPPFIILERGEPLDEWSDRMRRLTSDGMLDLLKVYQALASIARRLLMLHDVGFVHRDLKPSNVLWVTCTHEWTLIDFGSSAQAGVAADM